MSSSQKFSVYKTLPYNVYARAAGKWDYLQENQIFNSSQTINITMQNYDGLSMKSIEPHNSAMPLDFSQTILPWKWDYYDYLKFNNYCLMPVGQWYYDVNDLLINISSFTANSNIIFTGTVASGFTNTQYIQLNENFPSSFSTWELVIKFKFSTSAGNYQSLFSIYNGKVILGTYLNKIKLWTNHVGGGNEEQGGITNLSSNTDYWVRLVWDGTIYTAYLSTTGAFSGEETTELTVTPDGQMQNYSNVLFGSSRNNWYASNAQIDLNGTYIKVNNEYWWKGVDYLPTSLQGCTFNYTDDGSAVTLNAFVVNDDETIVLTPDNSYTNGYLLGTVNIPSHNVYSYSETTSSWTQPVLSADGTIGGNSFACLSNSDTGNGTTWKAFDGNNVYSSQNDQVQTTGGGTPQWIEFYNPDPLVVTHIDVYNGWGYTIITDWQFQYSDDNLTWITISQGTNNVMTQGGKWGFDVNNSGAHKYYRLYVTDIAGWAAKYMTVTEITITAYTASGTWTPV